MRVRQLIPLALTLGLLFMVSLAPLSHQPMPPSSPCFTLPSSASICSGASKAKAQLPISFEPNRGQAGNQARFLAHGTGYSLFLTPQEALLALNTGKHDSSASSDLFSPASADAPSLAPTSPPTLVGMQFLNANPQPEMTGEHLLPGIVNYLLGNDPAAWHTNIPTYAQVRYHNIYPGIDLVYYGNQGHLEYDFIVGPGSNPSQIHLNFTGVNRLSLNAQNELLLHLPADDITEGAPHVYQEVNSVRQQVASSYILQGTTEVGFALGAYDTNQPLVIDPSVFFSTYLGGLDNDYARGLAIDSTGNSYITGATSSTNFPSQNPLQPTFAGGSSDAFVTKVNATGTVLVYSTYLGGSGADLGNSIAVDSAGNAYLTGVTFSTNFPTQNPLQATLGSNLDNAFVAKLNATGTALVYSTYLGGSSVNQADWGSSIAVDSAGNAYLTGGTSSTNFPTSNPLQASNAGTANAFVAKVNAAGTALVYSTYLGGSNYDYGAGIAVDSAGAAYVTGVTHSSNFPTLNPLQSAYAGGADAFVAKLNATGTALVYSSYLGGSGNDGGFGIAVDSAHNAYITGGTSSTNFPTSNPLQSANAGGADAFVAKVNAAGTALAYSTYLGGTNNDEATGIAVDNAGNVYLTGSTSSSNYPTFNPLQSTNAGGADAFVTRLSASGNILQYSSYLGGKSNDWGNAIALDSKGYVYIAGATASSGFPTVNPIQAYGGLEDGFLTKINSMIPARFQVNPGNVALITTPGASPSQQILTVSNLGDAPLNWSSAFQPAASWVSVSPASGSVSAGASQPLTLTFNTPSTTPQPYTTTLVLTDPNASNSPVSIPITVVSATVSKTWYFAEGYTGTGFTEYLTVANPNPSPTTVTVQYLIQGGSPLTKQYQIAANNRFTLNVNAEVGANQSLAMVVTGSQPIIAERPMYFTFPSSTWHINLPGGSDVLGATSLGTDFDFGYLDTTTNHDTYLTILNQDPVNSMQVSVSYFPAAGGSPTVIPHTVQPNSRGTIHVNDEHLPLGTYSALVHLSLPGLVERPLYLKDGTTGNTGAADVVGVTQPLKDWYFAEGFIDPTFSERYILSNPSTSQSASGTITFFLASGAPVTTNFSLAPGQQTIITAGSVPGVSGNNSAQVQADQPILAERFMSFRFTPSLPGASDVLGAAAPSNLFYFAEGFTGPGFSEYLTIENPDPTQTATVQVSFLPSTGGAPIVQVYTIAPSSRFTLNTVLVMPGQSFSMVVESNVKIVAERPMYFTFPPNQTGGSDVVGYQP